MGTGGPKFKKLEEDRNFIAVNAVQELPFISDLQQFAEEPKSLFIPDLTTERLQLAMRYRQKKKANESVLSISQQQSLDEILQIPISNVQEPATEINEVKSDADEYDSMPLERDVRPTDHAARVILAVKNHNLAELELVLDTEGLSVETRDYHGNTLFILACQQGSKKLAKFLLRRGADMNVQNNGGNTALHY
jgi:ankyrin repeat protein